MKLLVYNTSAALSNFSELNRMLNTFLQLVDTDHLPSENITLISNDNLVKIYAESCGFIYTPLKSLEAVSCDTALILGDNPVEINKCINTLAGKIDRFFTEYTL